MRAAIFVTTVVAEASAGAAVLFSLLFPQWRLWPPDRGRAWTSIVVWLAFFVSAAGAIATGLLDWGSLRQRPWIRWGPGVALWLGGFALAQWAIAALTVSKSFGDGGGLVRRGPYRFSRNPQYVGFIVSLFGWALVASSRRALIVACIGVVPLVLVPFAEEPWLAALYGADYEAYKRSVPRFVPVLKRRA